MEIKVLGKAFTVTANVLFTALQALTKHKPASLKLVNPETKEEVFAMGTGTASISKYGISFSNADANGFATATFTLPDSVKEDKKAEFITEQYGGIIVNANLLTEQINHDLANFNAEMAYVQGNITVIS